MDLHCYQVTLIKVKLWEKHSCGRNSDGLGHITKGLLLFFSNMSIEHALPPVQRKNETS